MRCDAGRLNARCAAALLIGMLLVACAETHTKRESVYGAGVQEGSAAGLGPDGELHVAANISSGGIKLRSAESGRLYDAVLSYCADHTEPRVVFEPGGDAGARAALTLELHGRVGVFQGFGGETNRMDLRLARGVPLDMDLGLGVGESVVDLRGLSVRALRVLGGAGDSRIVFGDPNPEPAGHVVIEGPIGDLSVDRVGNSNASDVRIRGGVGSLEVDLRGAWMRDATILVEAEVGNLKLTLPEGPGVALWVGNPWREKVELAGYERRGDTFFSESYDASQRKVHVRIEAGLGRLFIERIDRT